MTVIRPNSISGVSSITGQGGDITIFRADGTAADVTVNNITSGIITSTNFKTGSSNLHSTGLNVSNTFVDSTGIALGAGSTVGAVTGVTTYYGDGSQLSGISVDSTKIETGNTKIETIDTGSDGHLKFTTEGTARSRIDVNGHFTPEADNTYDLGTSSLRWRDIYTGDLNLSNEGRTNDVDGTWGNYTIQEGESDLFLINNRTGKKYKFLLQEVE